jgi:hypothetical protein
MISGHVLTTEFPQRSVEITDVDYVARGFAYLYAITNAKRLAHQNVNPSDEAFHWGLHSESDNDGTDAKRSHGGVPIYKNDRDDNDSDRKRKNETLDALKRETSGSAITMARWFPTKIRSDARYFGLK